MMGAVATTWELGEYALIMSKYIIMKKEEHRKMTIIPK